MEDSSEERGQDDTLKADEVEDDAEKGAVKGENSDKRSTRKGRSCEEEEEPSQWREKERENVVLKEWNCPSPLR